MPPQDGTVAIKNVLSIIVSVATILAAYSGFIWFVLGLKFDTLTTRMDGFRDQLATMSVSIDTVNGRHSIVASDLAKQGEKIRQLESRQAEALADQKVKIDKRK